MALSEREKRVLEELERGLYESDSSFAARMGGSQQKLAAARANSPKRIIAGSALALIGLTEILFSLIIRYPAFAILGFALMVIGLSLATGQFGRQSRKAASVSNKSRKSDIRPGIQSRFEDRWDRRQGR